MLPPGQRWRCAMLDTIATYLFAGVMLASFCAGLLALLVLRAEPQPAER